MPSSATFRALCLPIQPSLPPSHLPYFVHTLVLRSNSSAHTPTHPTPPKLSILYPPVSFPPTLPPDPLGRFVPARPRSFKVCKSALLSLFVTALVPSRPHRNLTACFPTRPPQRPGSFSWAIFTNTSSPNMFGSQLPRQVLLLTLFTLRYPQRFDPFLHSSPLSLPNLIS
ncbi:hypothetical protein EDB81DRAFT_16326 [Dactylonectria macrodidyma]|uniref:Uncharacterized protein n=1 Tax=Dactylonectria macrodidyma TaxID=307937 RepID=A0A9P9JIK6_9HYPO|nr:hypothetical protein EDB81DRAFT_16326 [Dactylonectria macrodidyma]